MIKLTKLTMTGIFCFLTDANAGWKREQFVTEKFTTYENCIKNVEGRIAIIKDSRDNNPNVKKQYISPGHWNGYLYTRYYEATVDFGFFRRNLHTQTIWTCQSNGFLTQEVLNYE